MLCVNALSFINVVFFMRKFIKNPEYEILRVLMRLQIKKDTDLEEKLLSRDGKSDSVRSVYVNDENVEKAMSMLEKFNKSLLTSNEKNTYLKDLPVLSPKQIVAFLRYYHEFLPKEKAQHWIPNSKEPRSMHNDLEWISRHLMAKSYCHGFRNFREIYKQPNSPSTRWEEYIEYHDW